HQRLKTTTIYVTHDQIEAMTLADRIVVMHDGLVEQVGAPLELYDRPQNLFVAGFIGSPAMNFLNGRIHADGRLEFEGANGVRLPLLAAPGGSDGPPLIYCIKAGHLGIPRDGAEAQGRGCRPPPTGGSPTGGGATKPSGCPETATPTNRAKRSG